MRLVPNQPGEGPPRGSHQQGPWGPYGGGGRRGQQPPDLDEIVRKLRAKLGGFFKGGGGSGGGQSPLPFGSRGIALIVAIALLLWLASGIYRVGPSEQGVVQRFGAHVKTTQPGLHYHLPYPIETVRTPEVTQIRRIEIGYRSREGEDSLHVPKEALMLTGDENIVDLQFAVQYHIRDAAAYLFNVADSPGTVHEVAETSVREVLGQRPINDVLTRARAEIQHETLNLIQSILDSYDAGLNITRVSLHSAQPPEPVRPAFRDVISAREDRSRARNEAQAYANDIIPRARGRAQRILQEAQAYQAEVTKTAHGTTDRFKAIYQEYKKAPEVTRKRLYLETMETILARSNKVLVDLPDNANLLYLPLQRAMAQAKGAASGAEKQKTGQAKSQPQPSGDRDIATMRQEFEKRIERIRQGQEIQEERE